MLLTHRCGLLTLFGWTVAAERLELPTSRFVGACSAPLSYAASKYARWIRTTNPLNVNELRYRLRDGVIAVVRLERTTFRLGPGSAIH
jgi:hypothetical protein